MKFSEIVENYEFSNLSRFNHLKVLKTAKKIGKNENFEKSF